MHVPVQTPTILLSLVWPLPLSLATTYGISFDFSSSPYLDVSVREVPSIRLFDSAHRSWFFIMKVSPFRNPRIEAYLQLPAAYRSLSRLSSAPDAKAFTLCSCSLELFYEDLSIFMVHSILSRIAESRFTVYLEFKLAYHRVIGKIVFVTLFLYLERPLISQLKSFPLWPTFISEDQSRYCFVFLIFLFFLFGFQWTFRLSTLKLNFH